MAYAWQKMADLPTITAFQYNFRHMFQAVGAPEFEEKGHFAKEVLGIKDWSEVRHRGLVMGE